MAESDPSRFVSLGGELTVSGAVQVELLRGMMERGVSYRSQVRGYSMVPLIRDGDVVTIAPMAGRNPQVGQVVAFVLPSTGGLALHRVVARAGGGWLVRGDNCYEGDGVVTSEEILGRVVRVDRSGRKVRFGTAFGGGAVAWLSRKGGIPILHAPRRLARRVATSAVRCVQRCGLYRAMGRRFGPRVEVVEANERESEEAILFLMSGDMQYQDDKRAGGQVINWVAKHRGKVVGFVQLAQKTGAESPWEGGWLRFLVVRGRYRGLGIGQTLALQAIETARTEGSSCLSAVVPDKSQGALSFFDRLGFEAVAVEAVESEFVGQKRESDRRSILMRKAL